VARRLAAAGYRVYAPDLRGHGKSEWVGKGGSYHLMDFVSDLDVMLDLLAEQRVILVGHSMGAAIASLLTSARPAKVRHLLLVEPVLPPVDANAGKGQRLVTQLDSLVTASTRTEFTDVDSAAQRLRRTTPALSREDAMTLAYRVTEACAAGCRWRWDPRLNSRAGLVYSPDGVGRKEYLEILRAICVPMLVVFGDESSYGTAADRQAFAAATSTGIIHLNGGHQLHHDDSEALSEVIRTAAGEEWVARGQLV
jgi:pimeloyl-ACP methyl ester carboxylesterase